MTESWNRPGRDCPGVDGTTVLLAIVLCRLCICTVSLGDTTRVALSRTFALSDLSSCNPSTRRLRELRPGNRGTFVSLIFLLYRIGCHVAIIYLSLIHISEPT